MNDEEIKQALDGVTGLQYDSLNIVREDRHDRASKVMLVEFNCDSLAFEQLTEIAGAYMTPNITIEAIVDDMSDPIALCKVTCRAPGDVSQLIVEGTVEQLPAENVAPFVEDFDVKTTEYSPATCLPPIAPDDCERDCGCGQPSAHEHDFEYPADDVSLDACHGLDIRDDYPDGKL